MSLRHTHTVPDWNSVNHLGLIKDKKLFPHITLIKGHLNMKRAITTLAGLVLPMTVAMTAQADFLGFRIGANSWQQDYDGEVRSSSAAIDEIDITDDLGLDDETGSHFYIAFEHPVPVLPNILLERTELDIEETASPTRDFTFDGVSYSATDQITTTSDLSHTDLSAYYEVLDNWVSLDIGLTLRQFDEGIELVSTTERAELDIDATVPLLFVAAKFELPLTGLYASAQAKAISYSDATLSDFSIALGYETDFGLGLEGGFRSFEIDYDDDDEEANLTIDGAYAGLFYHF